MDKSIRKFNKFKLGGIRSDRTLVNFMSGNYIYGFPLKDTHSSNNYLIFICY